MTMVAPVLTNISNVTSHDVRYQEPCPLKQEEHKKAMESTVVDICIPPLLHNNNKQQHVKPTRRVRFELGDNDQIKEHLIQELEPMTQEEIEARWCSLQDYARLKKENSDIARGLRSQKLNSHACSYPKTLMRVYASCVSLQGQVNDVDDFLLKKWTSMGHCHRGLERQSVPTVTRHAKKEKIRVIQQVLTLQANLKVKSLMSNDTHSDDDKSPQEIIAEHYAKQTLPAKHFALAFAQADEVAAAQEYQSIINTSFGFRTDNIHKECRAEDETVEENATTQVPTLVTP